MRTKFNPNHDSLGRFASAGAGSAKFKKWFGDSKVVDDDGNPLAVYHGTTQEFSEFARSGSAHTEMLGFDTYFFTDNKAVASTYAPGEEGRLVDSYLKIERPLEIDAKGAEWHEAMGQITEKIQTYRTPQEKAYLDFRREVSEKYAFEIEFDELPAKVAADLSARSRAQDQHILDNKKLYSEAKRQPHYYDGIIIKNAMDMTANPVNDRLHEGSYNPFSTQYVVFKPSQVKSASKNSGEYSADDNDFTKSIVDLVEKFNPHHDARGRFASGPGGGAKIKPSVGSATSTAPPAAFIAAVAQSKIDNEGWEERLVAHQAVQERLLKKIDAALEKDDAGTPLTPEQKVAYRSAFVNVTDNMNNHAIEALERHLDDVKFYSSAQSLTDKLVGLERMEPGKVILGAWSGTSDGANGSLHLDGGPGGKHDKFAAQQVYAHEVAHAIDWVPGSVTKIPTYKLKVSADEAEKTILDRIDALPIPARQKEAERANVLWNLGEPESFAAIGVKTDDLYQLTGHRELHRPGREISRSAKWISAHNQEIDALDAKGAQTFPLSKYATTSASEGFAEFGRLVFTAPREAKRQYPKCWAVWLEHGLVGNPQQKKASAE